MISAHPYDLLEAYLHEFLASRITRVELNRSKSSKLGTQVRARGLANAGRTSDQNSTICVHGVLPWLRKIALHACRPKID